MFIKYIISLFLLLNIATASQVQVVESFVANKTLLQKKVPKFKKKLKKKVREHRVVKKALKKKRSKTTVKAKKPKVVIIIDDISHKWQLQQLQRLPFKVTPSIFPPNRMNMKSNLLAKGLHHFMVHLPLESGSKKMNSMYKTLYANVSESAMLKRVEEIRRLFPNAHYVNNHTGSKFTKDYVASKKLYGALIKNGFKFVDSRTTKESKIAKVAKFYKQRYLKSDFFIDNKLRVAAIKSQINKGLQIAVKQGYVVMIGHPHPQTLKALRQSRNRFRNYNLIYIDEL